MPLSLEIVLGIGALLHAFFMFLELYPWPWPFALKGSPLEGSLTDVQQKFVAGILHNVGIYNGILAGGFLFALLREPVRVPVGEVMFAGALAAGIFGAATLESLARYLAAVQAAVGVFGLYLVLAVKPNQVPLL